jgi:hypothetical protein
MAEQDRRVRDRNVMSAPHDGPHHLDHSAYAYLTVTFTSCSPYLTRPAQLADAHPDLMHHGQVGALDTVHLLSVKKGSWEDKAKREDIISKLSNTNGVSKVESLPGPTRRNKRSEL